MLHRFVPWLTFLPLPGITPKQRVTNMPSRLLFASTHSYLDPSSGAALATRELLELLAGRGWDWRRAAGLFSCAGPLMRGSGRADLKGRTDRTDGDTRAPAFSTGEKRSW